MKSFRLTVCETDRKALRLTWRCLRPSGIVASWLVGAFFIYVLSIGPAAGICHALKPSPVPVWLETFYKPADKMLRLMPVRMNDAYNWYMQWWFKLGDKVSN